MKTKVLLRALWLAGTAFAGAVAAAGQADVSLSNADATLSQTSDTAWTLGKTGALNGATLTWTITATQGATVSGHLVVDGFITVTNSGSEGATIGNIVVNLQARSGNSWTTVSSDVADATHGDAATTAKIDPHASSERLGTFTENAASGHLLFMDANKNTVFSLTPEVTIPAGGNVNLLFAAGFDNNVLKLANGTTVRVEVLVSFGNAAASAASASNIDINGNGVIDPDEAHVFTVPARLGLNVPAETAGNQSVTLSDTLQDIVTTGTVTFSNPSISLGATSGTVSVQVGGGTTGGKITNCAHLTSASSTVTVGGFEFPNVNGVNLQACNTETIGPAVCTPGTSGCGWKFGDLKTYGQGLWEDPAFLTILDDDFGTVYAAKSGLFIGSATGFAGTGFTLIFDGSSSILNYLPAFGMPAPLNANAFDPLTTASGSFGGEVVALQLNVDFSDAGFLGPPSLHTGDLVLCGFTSLPALNGVTVRQFLGTVNTLLGGGSAAFTIGDLAPITAELNASFSGGTPDAFAQQHLGKDSTCQAVSWLNGDLITFTQSIWGATLLEVGFNTVYGATGGFIAGSPTKYTMVFTDPDSLAQYIPSVGTPAPLNSSVANPVTTASGSFGGDVVALKLNIDYADFGFLAGSSGLHFGDLTLCGFSTLSGLNGTTVRQFLGTVNTALSGGSTPYSVSDLDLTTGDINAAFSSGYPSAFAQQHLFNGACP